MSMGAFGGASEVIIAEWVGGSEGWVGVRRSNVRDGRSGRVERSGCGL